MQTGELLFTTGVAGVAFTVTATVPIAEVQPLVVTDTLYVPDIATVALVMEGF